MKHYVQYAVTKKDAAELLHRQVDLQLSNETTEVTRIRTESLKNFRMS